MLKIWLNLTNLNVIEIDSRIFAEMNKWNLPQVKKIWPNTKKIFGMALFDQSRKLKI